VTYVTCNNKLINANHKLVKSKVSVITFSILLTGYLLNTGGKSITLKGFKYGISEDDLNNQVLSSEDSEEFHAIINLPKGTYYYQAFAINSIGESNAEIKSFTV
jgi:hypothetical protein